MTAWRPPRQTPPPAPTTQARRTVPARPPVGQRPLLHLFQRGLTPEHPIVLGATHDGDIPALVRATGMAGNVRAGQQRWVVGDQVAAHIVSGVLVVVVAQAPDPPPPRLTRLRDGVPGSSPELLAGADQWPIAFTLCPVCDERAALPGLELCDVCAAARADDPNETALAKALRLAQE